MYDSWERERETGQLCNNKLAPASAALFNHVGPAVPFGHEDRTSLSSNLIFSSAKHKMARAQNKEGEGGPSVWIPKYSDWIGILNDDT